MRRFVFTFGSAIVASAAAAGAWADQPQIITNANGPAIVGRTAAPARCVPVDSGMGPLGVVVAGPPVAPAAVVSRELSLQPTYDRLATVQLTDTYTIIDPYADLRRNDPPGGLDENHGLRRAQRLWLSLYAPQAPRVITGSPDNTGPAAQAQADPSFVRAQPPATPASPAACPTAVAKAAPSAPAKIQAAQLEAK
jgi:hypothetical protein